MERNARPLSEERGSVTGGGSLNPDWVEYLMGRPVGWTSLEPMTEAAMADWLENGPRWDVEPVPRVATDVPNRVARLAAIGNGQVPQCMALAWETLDALPPPRAITPEQGADVRRVR